MPLSKQRNDIGTSLIRFLSYPVFFDPESPRAAGYVMEHFWAIRSCTRTRRLLKFLVDPAIRRAGKRDRERLADHPRFDRLRPYFEVNTEVVIDARRFFRVIDFDRREVINILKSDDLKAYYDNELTARRRLSGLEFIPRLIETDEEKKVFREEYVCERPFKSGSLRDLDPVTFADRLKEIVRQVRNSAPVRPVGAGDYLAGLTGEILSRPEADEQVRRYVRLWEESASRLDRVELAFSHGDFRPDQLFFARDGSVRIIDWENSGYFSRHRDLIGFYVNERWLYRNPVVSLESLLEASGRPLEAVCSLFLLELATVPVRIGRPSLLPVSISSLRKVAKRMSREIPGLEY